MNLLKQSLQEQKELIGGELENVGALMGGIMENSAENFSSEGGILVEP